MYRVTTTIKFFVPDGQHCNIDSKTMCRFCVKSGGAYVCSLAQEPLAAVGKLVTKTQECMWPTGKRLRHEEAIPRPESMSVDTFLKLQAIYNPLVKQGYSKVEAFEIAKKLVKE